MKGTIEFVRPGVGEAMVTLEVYAEDDRLICGVFELRGEIRVPPKKWLRVVRDQMEVIEREARRAGCAEVRLAGRDWSRVLPDYESMPGIENRLRKRL